MHPTPIIGIGYSKHNNLKILKGGGHKTKPVSFFKNLQMKYIRKQYLNFSVSAEISSFAPQGKVMEFHVMMHITQQMASFDQQLHSLHVALIELLADEALHSAATVSARCFLSDAANQQEQASKQISELLNCPVSIIKQPPLDGSKLALWLQLQTGIAVENDGLYFFEHNGYRHYHTTSTSDPKNIAQKDPCQQTHELLEIYEEQLKARGCTIEKNCIRTWFFLRDIDVNYLGFVEARKENFLRNGLNNKTHYIASTGIEGSAANPHVKVLMDTHAIHGLDDGQVQFLYAKDYLNPTYEYGVTFERGVRLDFGDRRHVYISGTASIDHQGQIMYPGDVVQQVHRTWENVGALLKEADCSFQNIMQMIVYLRDMADYPCVKKLYDEKFPGAPKIIVLAPICRSGWLVEMECIAINEMHNSNYRDL
jgi:enamine deaminase RidA (YjgF/YER057c/UK114 family)